MPPRRVGLEHDRPSQEQQGIGVVATMLETPVDAAHMCMNDDNAKDCAPSHRRPDGHARRDTLVRRAPARAPEDPMGVLDTDDGLAGDRPGHAHGAAGGGAHERAWPGAEVDPPMSGGVGAAWCLERSYDDEGGHGCAPVGCGRSRHLHRG